MNTFKTFTKTTSTAIIGLTLAGAASAATVGYNLEDIGAPVSAVNQSGSYADQYTYVSGANAVEMNVSAIRRKTDNSYEHARVGIFHGNGMGVDSADDQQHTLDNKDGLDILLFTFEQGMILDSVTSGWYTTDSDISIYAHDGTKYTKIEDQLNLSNDIARAVNASDFASDRWAITAFDGIDKSITFANDFVKLSFLSFTEAPSVPAPAPATLGLMGAVLAGFGLRRKAKRLS